MSGYVSARERGFRTAASRWRSAGARLDRFAGAVFILPAVLVILAFSIFPLLASLYVSLARLSFSEGGVELKFVGFDNYAKLLVGIDHVHFLGLAGPLTPVSVAVLLAGAALIAFWLYRYSRDQARSVGGFAGRIVVALGAGTLLWSRCPWHAPSLGRRSPARRPRGMPRHSRSSLRSRPSRPSVTTAPLVQGAPSAF